MSKRYIESEAPNILAEKSTGYVSLKFYDKDDTLSAPNSIEYYVHNITEDEKVKDWTSITASSEIEITLDETLTTLSNPPEDPLEPDEDENLAEVFRLSVKASYGADDKLNYQTQYTVKDLSRI